MKTKYENINIEELRRAVSESDSFTDATIKLGLNPKSGHTVLNIRRLILRNNISYEHFGSVIKNKESKIRYNVKALTTLVKKCTSLKEILCELDVLPIDSNYKTLKKHLSLNNIDYSHIKSINRIKKIKDNYTFINLSNIIKTSFTYKEVFEKLGLNNHGNNYNTIHKYVDLYGINTSHFNSNLERIKNLIKYNKISLDIILVENSAYRSTSHLKKRLYDENIKSRICELCGQTENWNGSHMSLILDHINGIPNDNRIENLRIVCPNCNATLPTHCGKNIKSDKLKNDKTVEVKKKKDYFCTCGKKISRKATNCIECRSLLNHKIEHPSHEILLNDVKDLGYSGTGRKYGVSDNAIRKWLK
jgi:hypothetical protein